MKNSVAHIEHCYGCGICAASCPQRIIEMRLDKRGFYAPHITDEKKCTDCGLCRKSCAYLDDRLAVTNEVKDWNAVWSETPETRKTCSSGGVAYELARTALAQGFEVVGVRYNADLHRAEHCICRTVEELEQTKGSKYLPSYTPAAFTQFERGKKYFVCGSPCQIDSLRRFIRLRKMENNFILMDFFCHGVPSYNMWQKFVRTNLPETKATDVAFRCKHNYTTNEAWPWHASFVVTCHDIRGGVYQPAMSDHTDWFYHYFLDNLCLGEQCHTQCKYKMYRSSADIRIGDAWTSAYEQDEKGVSAVLAFTEAGQQLLNAVQNLHREQIDLDLLCEGQMHEMPPMPRYYKLRLWLMRTPLRFGQIEVLFRKWEQVVHFKNRVYGFIRRHTHHA